MSFDLLTAIGAAMVPVIFSYGGWQTTNFIAGEIRNPRRNLARALVIGVAGVVALYVSVNLVCVRALGVDALAATNVPASAVMRIVAGEPGARLIALGIAVSTVGFLSQSVLTAPRVYFAMAEDGLFFRSVAYLSKRTNVPVVAIVLQSCWTLVIAMTGRYDQILNFQVPIDATFFGLSAACLFVLRHREKSVAVGSTGAAGLSRARSSGDDGGFILACWAIVANALWKYPRNSFVGVFILLLGLPVYFWRIRRRKQEDVVDEWRRGAPWRRRIWSGRSCTLRPDSIWRRAESWSYPLAELGVRIEDLEIYGPTKYGYEPLQERLARKCGVTPELVVVANGTAMANHLAMAACIEPGDDVLVERADLRADARGAFVSGREYHSLSAARGE